MSTIKITTKKDGTFKLELITARGNTVAQTTCKKGDAAFTKAIARLKTNAGLMPDHEVFFVWE